MMRLRKNRRIETGAVNAAQRFFEQNDCVFQGVDLANDYGKDAYLDLTHDQQVLGACIAIQVKGGVSYRRADGFAIPVDEHYDVWRNSSMPIAGIVHDPESECLYWCSITSHLDSLRGERPTSIPVPAENLLTKDSYESKFRPHFLAEVRRTAAGNCILELCGEVRERRLAAVYDCFAHGRSDARVLIALRHMLGILDEQCFQLAIQILTHTTPHPDIFWSKDNWVPDDVCRAVRSHFRWTPREVFRLLASIDPEGFHRGGFGEDVYMLLADDPEITGTIEDVLAIALDAGEENVAWFAFYLSLYWSRMKAREQLDHLIAVRPDVQALDLFNEARMIVNDQGFVTLFE